MTGIGGAAWLGRFSSGLPITGPLSHASVYPIGKNIAPPKTLESVPPASEIRFRGRAARSGFKNADNLLSDAMRQFDKGWRGNP